MTNRTNPVVVSRRTSIRTRLVVGFLPILAILVLMALGSLWGVSRINGSVDMLRAAAIGKDAAMKIAGYMDALRDATETFARTGDFATVRRGNNLVRLIREQALDITPAKTRDDLLADMDAYTRQFGSLAQLTIARDKVAAEIAGPAEHLVASALTAALAAAKSVEQRDCAVEVAALGQTFASAAAALRNTSAGTSPTSLSGMKGIAQRLGKPISDCQAGGVTGELARAREAMPRYLDAVGKMLEFNQHIEALIGGELKQRAHAVSNLAIATRDVAARLVDDSNAATLSTASSIIWYSATLTGLSLLIAALLAWKTGSSLANPVRGLTRSMTQLAAGNWNTVIPGEARSDEIGEMARAVSVFRQAGMEREQLEQQAAATTVAQARRAARIEQLIAEFESRTNSLLSQASSSGEQLRSNANSLDDIASMTADRARSVSGTSKTARGNVQSVASAAEELSASISEISLQINRTKSVVDEAVGHARATNSAVGSLSGLAREIGDIVQLIRSIAEQTNLLALNATIEAARAGVAGRGFAVVASEVKQLAEQTTKATDVIAKQIAGIQDATNQSVEAIQTISGVMEEIGSNTTSIAASVEEQGAATAEISSSIQHVANGTSMIVEDMIALSSAVERTSEISSGVLTASKSVNHTAADLQHSIFDFLRNVAAA